jgi:hypothetical protein
MMPPGLQRVASVSLGGLGMAGGLLLWWGLRGLISEPAGASSMAVRLGLGLAALLPAATLLFAMVLASSAARFATAAFDPARRPDRPFLVLNQRVIANTAEQFLVFAPALLAWAAGAGATAMPGVLAAGVLFAAARLAFWVGYHAHTLARAPGMAATMAMNGLALASAALAWLG